MRHAMPLRWIEQAEARQVLTAAASERRPAPVRRGGLGEIAADWLSRLRDWLMPDEMARWPMLQVEPALVRRPQRRAGEFRGDQDRGRWQ